MFVVTLPASASKNPKAFALKAKKAGADILEVRTDLTPNVKAFKSPLPILVANRGKRLIEGLKPSYIDREFPSSKQGRITGKLILSVHDYKKTPSFAVLKKIILRMQKEKPWAIKIATNVRNYSDLLVLLKLQQFLQKKKIRSIVLGMGDKAHLTRVLSPSRNVLTYATLDGFESSASGQLPMSFYRLLPRARRPALFGIIGGPQITASLSPVIHNVLFARHKIDALYSCFEAEDFQKTVRALEEAKITGLSVTAPFKREAFALARDHSLTVQQLDTANTLLRSGKGWQAFNTDIDGIVKGYPALKQSGTIAIAGAGGAVPALIIALQYLNPEALITVFARDTLKARRFLEDFDVRIDSLSELQFADADAVLCAISEDIAVALPEAKKGAIALDLRYNRTTKFLREAKRKGYSVHDGLPMLIHQAVRQFEHFTGKKAFEDDASYLEKILRPFIRP